MEIGCIGGACDGPPNAQVDVREWRFPHPRFGELRAVVVAPTPHVGRLPLVVALHGRGETVDARTGAFAWIERYGLLEALATLRRPGLPTTPFGAAARRDRVDVLDRQLTRAPLAGVVVACPSLPSGLGGTAYNDYASFLADTLLPKLRAEAPVVGTRETTGIDGVSLGGITALRIAMMRPDAFGTVGAMQPAILESPPEGHVRDAIAQHLGKRALRLLTTDDDVYRSSIVATSDWLRARNVAHELLVTPGAHDIAFIKSVGAVEMLAWHDARLRARS
jgi:hypothetical protein